jgi:16S rRNA (cytosine1402-N4)-methyltransferase
VLQEEVLHYLALQDGETVIDATFGAGGYTRSILSSAKCQVIALDQDPSVSRFASNLATEFGDRIRLTIGNFSEMKNIVEEHYPKANIQAVVMDLGVSSMQLDTAARGFSFQQDGPLDMRMGDNGRTAADFVNNHSEKDIADTLYQYGGERASRRIARSIVAARKEKPITTTLALAQIIRRAVRSYNDTIDPATRSFQAIRIWVNQELESLQRGLEAAEKILAPGGRLVVVTFHSLEDAIVKQFFAYRSGQRPSVSRHEPEALDSTPITWELLNKRPVMPSAEEIAKNPRSRSAKLRAARRVNVEGNC